MGKAVPGMSTARNVTRILPVFSFDVSFLLPDWSPPLGWGKVAGSRQAHNYSLKIVCPSGVRGHIDQSLFQGGRMYKKMAAHLVRIRGVNILQSRGLEEGGACTR